MKIDVHAHYVPEVCLHDVEVKGTDGRIQGLRIAQEGPRQVAYTNNAHNIAFDPPQIYSIERRLKDMGAQWVDMQDRKSTRLNSSHIQKSRMPSSA